MREVPTLSQVAQYGKYPIPTLYLSLETTDFSHNLKISVIFGFDALKQSEEIQTP